MFTFNKNLTQFGETCLGLTLFLLLFYIVLNIMYIVNRKMYDTVYTKYSKNIVLYFALTSLFTYLFHYNYVNILKNHVTKYTFSFLYIFPIILGLMFSGIFFAVKMIIIDYFTPKKIKLDKQHINKLVIAYTAILHTHGYVLLDYRGEKIEISAMIDPTAGIPPGKFIHAGTRCYISNINEGIALIKPFKKI